MNSGYLRSKDTLKSIMFKIILALVPLLIAGFYKNGIKLYIGKYVSFYGMLKPLLLDIIGFLIGIIVNIIYENIIKKRLSMKEAMFSSFHPLYGLLVASIVTINIRLWYFSVVTFIVFMISKFIKKYNINYIAFTALIIILISKLFGTFSFLNLYEQANILNLEALDYLIGRGSGGVNTTHVILLGLSLIILWRIRSYKREIAIYSIITYSICMLGYLLFTNSLGYFFENIFSNGILFSFVFVATDMISSSYTAKGKIIYGSLIGVFTFGLFLIYPPLAVYGAILLVSIFNSLIDKICLNALVKKSSM